MSKSHENVIVFKTGKNVKKINFEMSGNKKDRIITEGQEWGGLSCVPGKKKTEVKIAAGRKNSKECATWFKKSVDDEYHYMIHTLSGDNKPKGLNFAVRGILTINKDEYEICMGQGHSGLNNNWHIASKEILADVDAKNGTIGNRYRIIQEDSNTLIISTSIGTK